MNAQTRGLCIVFRIVILTVAALWLCNCAKAEQTYDIYSGTIISHDDSLRAADYYFQEAQRKLQADKPDLLLVLDDLYNSTALNPRNIEALCSRADILQRLGYNEEALTVLNEVLQWNNGRGDIWLKKIHLLFSAFGAERAIAAFDSVLEILPNDIDLWLKKYNALYTAGRRDDAIIALEGALRVDSTRMDLWLKKARICQSSDRLNQCMDAYEHVIRLNPDDKTYWTEFAYISEELGWFTKAVELYEAMHQLWPEDTGLWERHAELLYKNFRWGELTALMDRAIAASPRDVALRLHKLQFLQMSGLLDEMERESREILRRDTTREMRSDVYQAMETAYALAEHWDKAFAAVESLLALNPDEGWVWEIRAHLGGKVGRSAKERLADYNAAIDYYPRDEKGIPSFPDPWLGKCEVLVEMGRNNEALSILDSLIDFNSGWLDVWKSKARVLSIVGNTSEALSCIETALRLDPNDNWSIAFKDKLLSGQSDDRRSRTVTPFPGNKERYDPAMHGAIDSAWEAAMNAEPPDKDMAFRRLNVLIAEAQKPAKVDTALALKYIDVNPHDRDLCRMQAELLILCGKLTEAEIALTKAIEINSRDAQLWYDRAKVRARLDMDDEALQDLIKTIALDREQIQWIKFDADLRNLWDDSLFFEIVGGE